MTTAPKTPAHTCADRPNYACAGCPPLVVASAVRVFNENAKCDRCDKTAYPEDVLTDYTFTDGTKRRLHSACLEFLR